MQTPEKYLWPKELAAAVMEQRGLEMKVERIYAVRAQSELDRDGAFIDGRSTVTALLQWLIDHPQFVQRPTSVRTRRAPSAPVMI